MKKSYARILIQQQDSSSRFKHKPRITGTKKKCVWHQSCTNEKRKLCIRHYFYANPRTSTRVLLTMKTDLRTAFLTNNLFFRWTYYSCLVRCRHHHRIAILYIHTPTLHVKRDTIMMMTVVAAAASKREAAKYKRAYVQGDNTITNKYTLYYNSLLFFRISSFRGSCVF